MMEWMPRARHVDRAVWHKGHCSEVPSSRTSVDFWEGGGSGMTPEGSSRGCLGSLRRGVPEKIRSVYARVTSPRVAHRPSSDQGIDSLACPVRKNGYSGPPVLLPMYTLAGA